MIRMRTLAICDKCNEKVDSNTIGIDSTGGKTRRLCSKCYNEFVSALKQKHRVYDINLNE
jgi:hypothetical protein